MREERPITREAAEAMIAQVKNVIASGQNQATIELAGMKLDLESVSDGSFLIRVPGQIPTMRLFLDPATTPTAYPVDLPFVANESVTVSDFEGTVSLLWWSPSDPDRVFLHLEQHSIAAGWTFRDQMDVTAVPATRKLYVKDGLERYIMLSAGIVSLMQMPKRPANRGAPTTN